MCRYLMLPIVVISGLATLALGEERPWPAQYKIKPNEADRLTAADVVGPDGIVYPDWRYAGIGGGMNENWLILYNRFVVKAGPGISASTCSFDHIIRGNAIAVESDKQPAIRLVTGDCVGIEIVGNRIYGAGGKLVGGGGRPERTSENTTEGYTDSPPRPAPVVSSIFEWQRGLGER